MRRGMLGLVVCLVMAGFGTPHCEASPVKRAVGSVWEYLFSPVNCVANWVSDVTAISTHFVVCVVQNANPSKIIP